MKIVLYLFILMSVCLSADAQDIETKASKSIKMEYSPQPRFSVRLDGAISNIVAVNSNGEKFYYSHRDLERQLRKGTRYYRKEQYQKAFDELSELAIIGIKEAQAMIGVMYLHGLHGQQSTARGIAWLGVATELRVKEWVQAFDAVYSLLDQNQRNLVDEKVAEYIQKFGMETQNFVCRKRVPAGTNLPILDCGKTQNVQSPLYELE